jgi:hypothetical protein
MALPPASGPDVRAVRRAAGGCAGAGLALIAASRLGIIPPALIGRAISADGALSPEKIAQFSTGQQVFGAALLALGVLSIAAPGWLDRLRAAIFHTSHAAFAAALLALGAATALASFRFVFDGIPHVTDAISHLFQARILAEGRWFADLPECPLAFFQHHIMMTTDGKWFTKYSPGHPVLLAIGLRFGAPFALPLAAHLLLLLSAYGLARAFFAENIARAASLLLAVSPLNILLGGSLMSHTTFLAAFLSGAWAMAATMRRPAHSGLSVAAGFAFGWSLLIRPHEFLISAAAVGVGLLISRPSSIPLLFRRIPLLALGALPCLALQAIWNHELYGRAWALGYGFTGDRSLFPMFQSTFGLHDGFGWPEAARLTLHRLVRFEQALLGWPVTLPLLLLALPGARDPRIRFLAAACAVHAAVYFFYDYLGHEYEARYFFNILPPVLALMVQGIARGTSGRPARRAVVLIAAAAGLAHAAGAYAPIGLAPMYGPDYEHTNRCLHERARRELPDQSLVLIESDTPETRFRYSSGFLFNDPALTGRVVYARAGDADLEACIASAFPDRTLFRYVADAADWCNGRFVPLSGAQSAIR